MDELSCSNSSKYYLILIVLCIWKQGCIEGRISVFHSCDVADCLQRGRYVAQRVFEAKIGVTKGTGVFGNALSEIVMGDKPLYLRS